MRIGLKETIENEELRFERKTINLNVINVSHRGIPNCRKESLNPQIRASLLPPDRTFKNFRAPNSVDQLVLWGSETSNHGMKGSEKSVGRASDN